MNTAVDTSAVQNDARPTRMFLMRMPIRVPRHRVPASARARHSYDIAFVNQFPVDFSPLELSMEEFSGSVRRITRIDIREAREQCACRRSITCVTRQSRESYRIVSFERPETRVYAQMSTCNVESFTISSLIEQTMQKWPRDVFR